MPLWAKVIAGVLVALIAGIVVALVTGGDQGDETATHSRFAEAQAKTEPSRADELARRVRRLKKERRQNDHRADLEKIRQGEVSATDSGGPSKESGATRPASSSDLDSSFARLESEVSGQIGLAYSLAPGQTEQLGSLEVGHAWSSFKVPIVVTLMREQGEDLTPEQESLAASAITASDNDAAAALFNELEAGTGGNAASAIENVLASAGTPPEVATAPPPSGAVSSWGQTQWSLEASTAFYGAVACGSAYGPKTADLVLRDMENVIPEQQWGLGQAAFPSGTQIAYKAGWGPDGSESGPYLVRQAGVIRSASGQLVVTIAAQDSSGSFEAGVSDLNRVADWVAENLPVNGSC